MALPASVWWNIANDSAVASQGGLARALGKTLTDLTLNTARLGEMLDRGQVNRVGIESAVNFTKLEAKIEADVLAFNLKAARRAARESARQMGASRVSDAFIERVAQRRARSVARMMSRETRKAMSKAIRRMKREGFSRSEILQNARKMVGLNQQQANSVLSRVKALRESGAPRARLRREFDRLTGRQFRNRGKMTGAHETKIGAELGQDAAVAHATDEGEIENPRERWVSIRDGRRDPICKRLHGQTVPLGKRFVDPATGNSYKGPPEPHMTCRCAKHVLFRTVPEERRTRTAGEVALHGEFDGLLLVQGGHLARMLAAA